MLELMTAVLFIVWVGGVVKIIYRLWHKDPTGIQFPMVLKTAAGTLIVLIGLVRILIKS